MKLELNINDMLTLGGIEHYSDMHLVRSDGTADKPGVTDVSYVLLVRKGTDSSAALDARFNRDVRTPPNE